MTEEERRKKREREEQEQRSNDAWLDTLTTLIDTTSRGDWGAIDTGSSSTESFDSGFSGGDSGGGGGGGDF